MDIIIIIIIIIIFFFFFHHDFFHLWTEMIWWQMSNQKCIIEHSSDFWVWDKF